MGLSLREELERYKNSGSIYQDTRTKKDGTRSWCIAFYYDDINGRKQRKVISAGNRDDLEAKRDKFLTDLYFEKRRMLEERAIELERQRKAAEQVVPYSPAVSMAPPAKQPCSVTVQEAYEKFLETYKSTVAYSTYKTECTTKNRICGYLGRKKVAELEYDDFQKMINAVSFEDGIPAPYSSVFTIMSKFKRVLRYCWQKKWLTHDELDCITANVKIPTAVKNSDRAEQTKIAKFRDFEQLGEILFLVEGNRFYYLTLRILLVTGLRPGEFFALKLENINREHERIYIENAVTANEKKKDWEPNVKIGSPKNKGSKRYVPLPKDLFRYFDELEELMKKSGRRKESYCYGNGNLAIVSERGTLITAGSFGQNLSTYIKSKTNKASITLGIPRHCYQELLDRVGAKDSDIERSVGHVLPGIGNKSYKTNEAYLTRLLPYILEMDQRIEAEYQKARKRK